MKVCFDSQQLYYLPQFVPVMHELLSRGVDCVLVLYGNEFVDEHVDAVIRSNGFSDAIATGALRLSIIPGREVCDLYIKEKPDWIFFGNDCAFLDRLPETTRTALLYHGIGVKSCYYDKCLADFDVRFVEGAYRLNELVDLFPQANFVQVGFPKLDPLFRALPWYRPVPVEPACDGGSTILYAPTFYPSSIELMPKRWPEFFPGSTILIKPHFFSITNPKYAKQKRLLEQWAGYGNVRLIPYSEVSIVPYLAAADLLISEASSTLFEFAALDKPVVWLDYCKLRWTYRGPLSFRFKKRMDQKIYQYAGVAAHAKNGKALQEVVTRELQAPGRLREVRRSIASELIGELDGLASVRIADWILSR